jgi:hypothetical protein
MSSVSMGAVAPFSVLNADQAKSRLESLGVIFPAACGVINYSHERIYTQKSQCDSTNVPFSVSSKIS